MWRRRGRAGRLQRPDRRRRARLARGDDAARGRALPAPGRDPVQRPLHGADAARARRAWRARWWSCSTRASTPPATASGPTRCAREIEEAIDAVDSSTRTGSCAASCRSCARCCARTTTCGPKPYVSFKLDPTQVPLTPLPRPRFEIFVHSPRVEGVHLRGGSVARGGLRWSDRREDFRTEILGLMKAQMVKNALIVPVGREGRLRGQARRATRSSSATRRSSAGCWTSPTRSPAATVVPPEDVVRHDGDDPYLVVAADKGTATFSRHRQRGRRGVRLLARRRVRVRRLGRLRPQGDGDHGALARGCPSSATSASSASTSRAEDFTVAGIGDMSGDVFGNGMLLSRAHPARGRVRPPPRLPRPGPGRGVARAPSARRLFELPRSSLGRLRRVADLRGRRHLPAHREVDRAVASRCARRWTSTPSRLTPSELIQAILRAPVDLLWNGGIGTYVKAKSETHADVGDKANDARARQRRATCARRSSARAATSASPSAGGSSSRSAAGKVNTDAIDNAGGVNCSDHEVNIKVLLDTVVADGRHDRQAAQRAAGGDDRGGRRARAARLLHADAGAVAGARAGARDARRARPLDARPGGRGAAGPRDRGAAGRRDCRRAADRPATGSRSPSWP